MPYIKLDDGTLFNVSIPVTHLSQPERFRKSMKTFGVVFGAAVVSILIPVFHFVLVPALLIASVAAAVRQYNKVYLFDMFQVKCPQCQEDLKERLITAKENKISIYCFNCRRTLSVGV